MQFDTCVSKTIHFHWSTSGWNGVNYAHFSYHTLYIFTTNSTFKIINNLAAELRIVNNYRPIS